MTERITRIHNDQSTASRNKLSQQNASGNRNKIIFNRQKNHQHQNLQTNNINKQNNEQNNDTCDLYYQKIKQNGYNYTVSMKQVNKNTYNSAFHQFSFAVPQNCSKSQIRQQDLQQMFVKGKDSFNSLDLLKLVDNGKIADLNRVLTNPRSDSYFNTKNQYILKQSEIKQSEKKENIKRVLSSPHFAINMASPSCPQVQLNPQNNIPLKIKYKNQNENVMELQQKKKEQLISKIKILQQNLRQTLQFLETQDEGTRDMVKMGKLNRIQTIIKAKMQVDVKELLKLARQTK